MEKEEGEIEDRAHLEHYKNISNPVRQNERKDTNDKWRELAAESFQRVVSEIYLNWKQVEPSSLFL